MAGDYVYDFSTFGGAPSDAGQGGGMSPMMGGGAQSGGPGGASFMGGGSSGMSFMMGGGAQPGGPGGASSMGGGSSPGGAAGGSGGDASSMLGQSPFGRLLDLPGVTAESLFSNINPSDYSSVGGNPFAALGDSVTSGAYGGNPFAAIGPYVNQAVADGSGGMMPMGMQ